MKAATAEMARVLLDDLAHIREIISRDKPSPGDIRRLANLLRRILIYDELRKVATPRTGRVRICAPDMNPVYRSDDKHPIFFAVADRATLFGMIMTVPMIEQGPRPRQLPGYAAAQWLRFSICVALTRSRTAFANSGVSRAGATFSARSHNSASSFTCCSI